MKAQQVVYLAGGLILVAALFAGVFFLWHTQQTDRAALTLGVPPTTFNLQVVHAGERGCRSCHGNHLTQVLRRLPKHGLLSGYPGHPTFKMGRKIPLRVEDCLSCHAQGPLAFANYIHAIHLDSPAFRDMGGSCDSCHVVQGGKFLLYDDETKYGLMNGIVTVPTPSFGKG
ncbi:MAG: hypothetical protein M0031_01235 [Thermaerobacter sp.]|jgi:hypothetical protein|nr:hypothetical protein [Thermaerobacter sp.]